MDIHIYLLLNNCKLKFKLFTIMFLISFFLCSVNFIQYKNFHGKRCKLYSTLISSFYSTRGLLLITLTFSI